MKVCVSCKTRFDCEIWECPSCHKRPEIIGGYPAFSPESVEFSNGFKPNYFKQLAAIEENNFWFRSRNRLIIWILRRYFPKIKNFFEIGCGTGFVLSGIEKAFPNLALHGSEIFITGLDYAAKRLSRVELFQMDARKIPFEDEFDVIGAFDVLEHIQDDEAVLGQMFQATKPGGGIVVTAPQHRFLWSIIDEHSFHKRRYTRKDLVEKVERAGFEVIKTTSFVTILLPLMIISRLNKRNPDPEYDPTSELRIGDILNMVLEKLLDLEGCIIRLGFSFPAGGSLLLIARKASYYVS